MIRKPIASGMVFLCTALMLAACTSPSEDHNVSWRIEQNLQQIVSEPDSMTSSNPNDYIAGNPQAYEQILDTGEEGLHVLIRRLESSSDNGLKEWVMAQASTELLGEHNPVEEWHSGKDWLRQYKMNEE